MYLTDQKISLLINVDGGIGAGQIKSWASKFYNCILELLLQYCLASLEKQMF